MHAPPVPTQPPTTRTQVPDKLMQAAQELEASFLAEMLKSAGFGEARERFGGGAGEAQFSSLLVDAQAREMVQAGGIGLAEQLYESLKERGAHV